MKKFTSIHDKHKVYKPGLYRICPECGRNLLKTDFHKKHGRCKLCQDNSRPSCGCGCGPHAEKEYKIYDVPNDKYFMTQGHMDKANGLSRKELKSWASTGE